MLARSAVTSLALLAVGGLVVTAPLSAAAAPHTHAARTAAAPAHVRGGRVIVVLKDQTRAASTAKLHSRVTSASTARSSQRSVAASVRKAGGTVRDSFSTVNAIAATVTASEATRLAGQSNVAEVIPDARIQAPTTAANPSSTTTGQPVAPPANTCPKDPNKVQLEPQALEDTNTDSDVAGAKTARSLGYTGAGVTVAYMAEGIDIHNPDFTRNGHTIFSDYKDFSGDGPNADTSGGEAFLDASAIAAQGNQVYNVQNFSDLTLTQACKIRVEGEAPGVNLVGLKVYANGYSSTSGFLQAIDYAVNTDHVNVLNESFGGNPIPDTSEDVIRAADEAAVAKGVTVTASTGDAGITNTIGSPATDPAVISVGASTTYRFFLQTGYGGARLPGISSWLDNNISSLSSGGVDAAGGTVDIVAPGELNYAVCSTDDVKYADCDDYAGNPDGLEASGGTSESSPTVAGVAALVIQAYRAGHHGATPTPAQIKTILTSTAQDINAPADQQGAGLVDAYRAVRLAKSFGNDTASGAGVATSSSSFSAITAPKTAESYTETLTNNGSSPEKVTLGGRTLGAYSTVKTAQVTLSDANSPKYVDFQGVSDNYEKVTFTVPAGEDRLDASIAYQSPDIADLNSRDRMTLVDPNGALAGYSLPQGLGNYGRSEVADPVPGTWTAYIQSRDSADGGSTGLVKFAASVAKFVSFGTVSPSTLTVAPGKSGKATLTVSTPATPGNLSGSLVIASAGGGTTSTTTVPVTLRSEIPAGKQSFTQILTGGNGRDEYPGDVYFYDTTVAPGTPELNAAVKLLDDPNNSYQAALVSPDGNATAFVANEMLTGPDAAPQKAVQLHTLAPTPGVWTLVVDFAPVVSGTNISTPFTVTTDERLRTATAKGLPDSTKTVLKAGKTTSYRVTVENTGPNAESFFVDPRLAATTTYTLKSLAGPATAPVTDNLPEFLVPSDTTQIGASASTSGSAPIQFDADSPIGDPDLESTVSTASAPASLTYQAAQVTTGGWYVGPSQVGPYSGPATPEPVTASMTAKTLAFDTTMKSSTGDLWLQALHPNGAFLSTVTVGSGQTAVINVKVTPTAGAHTVHGTLFIDDANLIADEYGQFESPNGDQVAAIPYAYSVK